MATGTASASATEVPHWIGGAPARSHGVRRGKVHDPATGTVIRTVPFADAPDVDRAVAAASAALPEWGATPAIRRARILQACLERLVSHQAELAALITQEHGKVLSDAAGSVQRGIEVVEFACGIPHLLKGEFAPTVGRDVDTCSRREPVGVCAGITPFNFPAMVPLWMVPVAIACGNTFVLKPSEKVPSASVRLAQLFEEAGLPPGVLNVVHGDAEAVDALLAHPGIAAVSFVGSTPVARHVYRTAAAYGKRVQALGGAKNHAVVLPDADLERAADALAGAAYGSAGERCMAISAVVAVGEAGDRLVPALKARALRLRVGPGVEEGVEMGPLVSAAHRDRVRGFIDAGVAEGAELVVDGRGFAVPGHESGFFLGPTLFDRVTPAMSIYQHEIFGPVLAVLRVPTLDEAIALVNANPYGNGASIFTESGGAARRFEDEIQAGMVGINVPIPVPVAMFPFGGWKQSLFGDLHVYGADGIRFYTRTKVVTTRWPRESPGGQFNMPTVS